MTEPQAARDPLIERFLGPNAAAGGPFAILGLGHEVTDPASVRAGAARRLAQIDRHILRLTPEADEVRLAVHTAAAQLSDPALHAELAKHWPPGVPDHIPSAWRSRLAPVSRQLAEHARRVVGASGGWNERAKRRLAHLARTHRVSAMELVRTLVPKGTPQTPRKASPLTVFTVTVHEPGSGGRVWLVVHSVLVLLLVVMLTLTVGELRRPAPEAKESLAAMPSDEQRARNPEIGVRADISHHGSLEAELRNVVLIAVDHPDLAADRGARCVESFVRHWSEMPGDARDRIADLMQELVLRESAQHELAARVLAPVLAADQSEDPGLITGARAVVARLRDTPDTPELILDAVSGVPVVPQPRGRVNTDARLAAALDALRPPPARADDFAWWSRWSEVLAKCPGARVEDRTNARIAALSDLLALPTPPSESWRRIAAAIASGLSWRPGEPARRWMLARLSDESLNQARVADLTVALANDLSVPGVDPTMVLARNASAADRRALTAKYRSAWLAGMSEGSPVLADAMVALDETLAAATAPMDRTAAAQTAARLARVNAAAALLFAGEDKDAADILKMPERSPLTPPQGSSGDRLDDAWGAELMAASDPQQLHTLLSAVGGAAGFSPLAAWALLDAATHAPDRDARESARQIVVARSASPEILLALERAAAQRPSTVLNDLIQRATGVALPSTRDPAWSQAASAALLGVIAQNTTTNAGSAIELVELSIAELATRRAGGALTDPVSKSLGDELEAWLERNNLPGDDPLSGDRVRTRLSAALNLSRGSSQVTASYARALAEAIAGAGASHGSAPRSSIDRAIDAMNTEWAGAPTSAHQILAAERCEARMWQQMLEAAP